MASNLFKKLPITAVLSVFLVFLVAQHVVAAIGAYEFSTDQERARFQLLVQELRCPKCQNQNLSDSNSEISVDLRDQVARMVKEGLSDAEIKEYMVNRYGDYVLYRPPLQSNTMVLWWAPLIMVLIGAGVFLAILLRRRALASAENSGESSQSPDTAGETPEKATQSDERTV